jgi:preprotein translocase subunit YajC
VNPEIQVAQTAPAPDGAPGPGGTFGFFLPFLAMLLILYALMIRPQQKERKRVQQMQQELKKGDLVVTTGGMHGRITGISDDVVTVEIADRVRVRFNRTAVTGFVSGAAQDREKTQKPRKEKSA